MLEAADSYKPLFPDPLVEGFGNEVVLAFLTFTGCLLLIWIHHLTRPPPADDVHPDHAEDIQNFRQHVGRLSDEEIARRIAEANERDDKTCAICISNASYACLTNCGHIFCCDCIVGYWNHRGNLFSPITCAICRTPVTILLPVAWPTREEADSPAHYQQNVTRLDDYNRRFSGDRPWTEYFADIPVVVPFIVRNLLGMNGIMIMFRLRVIIIFVAVIVYTLMPLDIFPEGAYGIVGFLDDIFVIALTCVYLAIALRYFFSRRWENQAEAHPPPPPQPPQQQADQPPPPPPAAVPEEEEEDYQPGAAAPFPPPPSEDELEEEEEEEPLDPLEEVDMVLDPGPL